MSSQAAAAINDDFLRLKQAWTNEKCSPDLLPYEHDIVTVLLDQIKSKVMYW